MANDVVSLGTFKYRGLNMELFGPNDHTVNKAPKFWASIQSLDELRPEGVCRVRVSVEEMDSVDGIPKLIVVASDTGELVVVSDTGEPVYEGLFPVDRINDAISSAVEQLYEWVQLERGVNASKYARMLCEVENWLVTRTYMAERYSDIVVRNSS